DLGDREKFSANVYGEPGTIRFTHISNLFHPLTVDPCFEHDGHGICGGIKTVGNDWNYDGHRSRIIEVDDSVLALFALLYDAPETPKAEARLPSVHSRDLLSVLRRFAAYPDRLGHLSHQHLTSEMWHETNAVKSGTIRRETRFPKCQSGFVFSGPHISVGNPLFQTPRSRCVQKADYDLLDLTVLPEDYVPRTNYVPDCDAS